MLYNPLSPAGWLGDTHISAPAFVTAAYLNRGVKRVAQSLVLRFDLAQALPFLACAAVFASALFIWPAAALVQPRGRRAAGFARWLATVTLVLDLLFGAALVTLILLTSQRQPGLLVFGLPAEAAPLFVAPWIGVVLTAGLEGRLLVAGRPGAFQPGGGRGGGLPLADLALGTAGVELGG